MPSFAQRAGLVACVAGTGTYYPSVGVWGGAESLQARPVAPKTLRDQRCFCFGPFSRYADRHAMCLCSSPLTVTKSIFEGEIRAMMDRGNLRLFVPLVGHVFFASCSSPSFPLPPSRSNSALLCRHRGTLPLLFTCGPAFFLFFPVPTDHP